MDDNDNLTNNDNYVDSNQNNVPYPEPIPMEQHSVDQRDDRGHRRKRKKDRFDAIIADNKLKSYQQQQLLQALQEKEAQLAEARALAQQNAHNSNIYYERSLEDNEQRILRELELAKEEGDIKKEIEIHRQLADVTSQKHTQLLSKALAKQQPVVENYQPNYPVNPPLYPESAPEQYSAHEQYDESDPEDEFDPQQEWLRLNPWANPLSDKYDPDSSYELRGLSQELNKILIDNNRSDMIGTPEYLNSLSSLMNEQRGNPNNDNNPTVSRNNMKSYPVAPVTKKGSSMADQYLSRNNYQGYSVPDDEIAMARKMIPVYSNIHKRPFTEEEVMKELKRGKSLVAEKQRLENMQRY